ncbi:ArsR/SmtB family transcription factor [bacterium RCC_150]
MVTDDVFAVIAEATRRDILVSLRSGDKAVGELVEELSASQPTISKHLKVLREADLVSMRAQGQKRYYALNPKPLAGVASWLETFDVGRVPAAGAPSEAAGAPAEPTPVARASRPRPAGQNASRTTASPAVAEVPATAGNSGAVVGAVAAAGTGSDVARTDVGRATEGTETTGIDDTVPQQIGRTVGRAATKAADLLANLPNLPNLPKFGRKK